MSAVVPSGDIERIVGVQRHATRHVGRAVEAEQTVYILHSHECKASGIDLRECPFSLALDRGINPPQWVTARATELPVMLEVIGGRLVPTGYPLTVCCQRTTAACRCEQERAAERDDEWWAEA